MGVSARTETRGLALNNTGINGRIFFYRSDAAAPPDKKVPCRPLAQVVESFHRAKFMKLDSERFVPVVLEKILRPGRLLNLAQTLDD